MSSSGDQAHPKDVDASSTSKVVSWESGMSINIGSSWCSQLRPTLVKSQFADKWLPVASWTVSLSIVQCRDGLAR